MPPLVQFRIEAGACSSHQVATLGGTQGFGFRCFSVGDECLQQEIACRDSVICIPADEFLRFNIEPPHAFSAPQDASRSRAGLQA